LNINRRLALTSGTFMPLASSLLAVLAAFLVGGLFLEARGKDAIGAYQILIQRGLGSSFGLTEILIRMAPLLIVSAGLLISLKAGVWNIGIDGQVLIGAMAAGIIAPEIAGSLPDPLMWLIAGLAGFLGGLLWALTPAILKVRWGLNEIITTLMMNYVALNITSWLVKGPIKDPDVVNPQTKLIPKNHRFIDIPGTDIHIGLLIGLVIVVLVAILFRSTVAGFMFSMLGLSRRAALHAGMPVNKLTIAALLLSGGFAGLAGANDVLGVKGLFQGNWDPGYGFTAFALVYLARLNPFWLVPFAAFFSLLSIGGEMMVRPKDIPTYYVEVLEGLMLIFFAVAVYFERVIATRGVRDVELTEMAALSTGESA
jgi:general nucleoside transport system permease protein